MQNTLKKSSKKIDILEQELVDWDNERAADSISNRDHWAFWLIWLTTVLIWYTAYKWYLIIYLVITAFILAMALESIIWFFNKRASRGFSILISYFILVIFFFSIVLLIIPFILTQLVDLFTVLLEQLANWQTVVQQKWLETVIMDMKLPEQVKVWLSEAVFEQQLWDSIQAGILANVDQLVSFWTSSLKDAGNIVVTLLTTLFSTTIQMFLVFVMSIFFSIEKDRVIHLLAKWSGHVQRTELVLMKLYRKLGLRLRGQWILCLSIFIAVGIWLNVLSWVWFDLPNKMTLALIAWMLEFIPYLWPILWMLPALLIALTEYGISWVIAVYILYALIQQSENNILVPMVMSQTLWSSPLLIFICMIMWGTLFGFLWVLLAVPISVIITILYDTYSKNK